MATLNAFGVSYTCDRAQKGVDFIRLLDESGNIVFFAEGISDFSDYNLVDGTWENPLAVTAPLIGASAALSDNIIVLDVPSFVNLETGLHITFVAPCNCDAATGVSINGTTYDFVDAMGNGIEDLGEAFCAGSVVSVIIDVINNKAYLQNAASAANSGSTVALDFSNWESGSFTETLDDGSIVTHNVTYGSYGDVTSVGGITISGVS